jgi:hypothetical protein
MVATLTPTVIVLDPIQSEQNGPESPRPVLREGDNKREEAMKDDGTATVTEEIVQQLAQLAQLELSPERRAAITPQLNELLTEANRVNRFMDSRREVGPGVRFHHPQLEDDE